MMMMENNEREIFPARKASEGVEWNELTHNNDAEDNE
jgi:hypothetical protein